MGSGTRRTSSQYFELNAWDTSVSETTTVRIPADPSDRRHATVLGTVVAGTTTDGPSGARLDPMSPASPALTVVNASVPLEISDFVPESCCFTDRSVLLYGPGRDRFPTAQRPRPDRFASRIRTTFAD